LGFLVQSCKYDFKNQKRTSNVQFFGLSKFLVFKNVPPLNSVVKHYKLKNSILLIYLNDIHHQPQQPASLLFRPRYTHIALIFAWK